MNKLPNHYLKEIVEMTTTDIDIQFFKINKRINYIASSKIFKKVKDLKDKDLQDEFF